MILQCVSYQASSLDSVITGYHYVDLYIILDKTYCRPCEYHIRLDHQHIHNMDMRISHRKWIEALRLATCFVK